MKPAGFWVGVVMVAALGVGAAAQQRAGVALRAAIEQETVRGDLKGAIAAYQRILDGYPHDRPVRAQALLRMAECYQKLGDVQAKLLYERVIREFSDQKNEAEAARARVARAAEPATAASRRVLTAGERGEFRDVSMDGRKVLLDDGGNRLIVHDLISGLRKTVDAGPSEQMGSGRFSPDGMEVAFTTITAPGDRVTLQLSNPNRSAPPRTLWAAKDTGVFIGACGWTIDGTRVIVSVVSFRPGKPEVQLATVSTADGTMDVISTFPDQGGACAVSPDGRYLAHSGAGVDGDADIFVTDLRTRTRAAIGVHRANDTLGGWTPSGDGLVFSSQRSGGIGLWLLPVQDGRAAGNPRFLLPHSMQSRNIGMTRAGALFYQISSGSPTAVRTGTFDFGSGQWHVEPAESGDHDSQAESSAPDWSPDGSQLAYAVRRGPVSRPTFDVAFQSSSSGRLDSRVATPLLTARWLHWTPDGAAVLIYGSNGDAFGLWRVSRDGQVSAVGQPSSEVDAFGGISAEGAAVFLQREYTNGGIALIQRDLRSGADRELFHAGDRAGYPVVSPDGTKLYFSRSLSEGPARLRTYVFVERDLATGTEREISPRRNLAKLNLSPDGRFIVTGSNEPDRKRRVFLLIPTAGGEPRVLMDAPLSDEYLSGKAIRNPLGFYMWAPDGATVVARNDLNPELWLLSITDGKPRKIAAQGMGSVYSAGEWSIHPDGRRVAFHSRPAAAPRPAELWVLENLLPVSQKAATPPK